MIGLEILTARFYLFVIVILPILIGIIVILYAMQDKNGLIKALTRTHIIKINKHPEGIVFGKIPLTNLYVYSSQDGEQHVLVLGGTGLGKTTSILVPTLRRWHGPKFVIDVSGDIHPNVYEQKYVLDPFGTAGNIRYDVLSAVDKIEDENDQDLELMRLAILMMPEEATDSSAARYYHKGGLTILQAALVCGYRSGLDFVDICKIIRFSSLEDLFEMVQEHPKSASIIAPLIGQDPINLAGCKDVADSVVELFALNRYVADCIGRGPGSISPESLESKSIYLVIPTSELTACEQLMHIITAQMIDYVLSRQFIGTGKAKILLCLDELTALGKLEYLIDLLARSRKNGCRVLALTQSIADLEMVYPKEYKSMIENFGFKVILAAEEYETQKYLSNLIGDYKDHDGSLKMFYRPTQLSNLGNKLLVLFRGGHIKLTKAPFFKDKYQPTTIASMDAQRQSFK